MQVSTISPVVTQSRTSRILDLAAMSNKLIVSPQLQNKLFKKRRFSMLDVPSNKQKFLKMTDGEEKKDYLEMSSATRFNPNASPVSSILSKRRSDVLPDSSPLTSSAKQKRVGFMDPVSSTKEYLITEEEEKLKTCITPARCLKYDNEDEDENLDANKENEIIINEEIAESEAKQEIEEITAIKDHDYDAQQNTDVTTSDEFLHTDAKSEFLTFKNKNELMEYITKNLSLDELLEKLTQGEEESMKKKELITKVVQTVGYGDLLSEYFSNASQENLSTEQNAIITNIVSELSKLMETNRSVKHKTLGVLTEKHSEEFLKHALQENSPSAVCDKIGMQSIVRYLIHKVNVRGTGDHEALLTGLNNAMMTEIFTNTNGVISTREKIHELMQMIFANQPKMETFDICHDFLRKLLENH